jgi:predicted DNA binding CopG/RHH family protein
MLKTRVTEETKRIIDAVARQQQLTESAWLRRLIATTLQTAGVTADAANAEASEHARRAARLMIRLIGEDQLLLHARAIARGMPAATYVSELVRSHLRGVAPLPKDELQALKRAIAELGAIGRNLNQLARAANQAGRVVGPGREELRALLGACEGLRDHVRALLDANLRSWEVGHAEASR